MSSLALTSPPCWMRWWKISRKLLRNRNANEELCGNLWWQHRCCKVFLWRFKWLRMVVIKDEWRKSRWWSGVYWRGSVVVDVESERKNLLWWKVLTLLWWMSPEKISLVKLNNGGRILWFIDLACFKISSFFMTFVISCWICLKVFRVGFAWRCYKILFLGGRVCCKDDVTESAKVVGKVERMKMMSWWWWQCGGAMEKRKMKCVTVVYMKE